MKTKTVNAVLVACIVMAGAMLIIILKFGGEFLHKSTSPAVSAQPGQAAESHPDATRRWSNEDELEELAPTRWTPQPAAPVGLPQRVWPSDEVPTAGDLPDSIWWDYFKRDRPRRFTAGEREALLQHGLFLEETDPLNDIRSDDMIDLYNELRTEAWGRDYSTIPVFISSDFLLHVFHVTFDRMLQDVEERKLYHRVSSLVSQMLAACQQQLDQAHHPKIKKAITTDIAFFSVTKSLLDSSFVPDPAVTGIVAEELHAIAYAVEDRLSPIQGSVQDYTQFRPRGHYTKTERLARYFRAMMWMGRTSFPAGKEEATINAIMMTRAWAGSNARKTWEGIFNPLSVLVGQPDDLTPLNYETFIQEVYAGDLSEANLLDPAKLGSFMELAKKSAVSRISDRQARPEAPREVEQAFRFLGQRFIPDSYIFTRLTSPRVGSDDRPRNMPCGTDVMAVLGSPVATRLLEPDFAIPCYHETLLALTREFSAYPDRTWTQTVYWGWLNSLRAVVEAKDGRYPPFMRSRLWQTKSLLTALASWAELRHDTILYAKQSGAEMGEGEEEEIPPRPPQPKSYVEPDLVFFNRFVDLIQQTGRTLSEYELLSSEYLRKFSLFLDRVLMLREVARLELQDQPVSTDTYDDLLYLSSSISSIVIPEHAGDIIDTKYKQMACVSDVHTDYFAGQVLEVGVGVPQRIYVAVKDKSGGSRVCVGYVYSYYEFHQPMGQRMTDDEWKSMIYPVIEYSVREKEPQWSRDLRVAN